MQSPEIVSATYEEIAVLTHTHATRGGEFRTERPFSSEHIEQFYDNPQIEALQEEFPIVELFFVKQSLIKLRHARDVLPEGNDLDFHGDGTEIVEGRRYITSPIFVTISSTESLTTFASQDDIVASGNVNDYTAELLHKLSTNGRYSDSTLRALLPIISTPVRSQTAF